MKIKYIIKFLDNNSSSVLLKILFYKNTVSSAVEKKTMVEWNRKLKSIQQG